MKTIVVHLAAFLSSLGGFGLFLLGIIDSSFLFLPLGIDLLLMGLTAQHRERMLLYAALCAAGSVIGCFTTDWISRKGGEAGLEGRVSPRKLAYLERVMRKRGALVLAVASILPPGFPFTPVVAVAAALKYPRPKLLGIIAVFRFIRFAIEGWLAIVFGSRILKIAGSPVLHWAIFALVLISIAGSAWSVHSWFRKSKVA